MSLNFEQAVLPSRMFWAFCILKHSLGILWGDGISFTASSDLHWCWTKLVPLLLQDKSCVTVQIMETNDCSICKKVKTNDKLDIGGGAGERDKKINLADCLHILEGVIRLAWSPHLVAPPAGWFYSPSGEWPPCSSSPQKSPSPGVWLSAPYSEFEFKGEEVKVWR